MEIIIDGVNQKIDLNNKIGEGSEGKVYLFNNNTYKIYYPCSLYDGFGTKEKRHGYLINIPTKQIILPSKLIYNKFGRYIGYTALPIAKSNSKLIDIETKHFVKNLQILENDIKLLSQNKVLMADVKYYNFIYNGSMYIIDPGRYRLVFNEKEEELYNQNIEQYKKLLLYLLENEMHNIKLLPSKIKIILDLINKEMENDICYYFKNEMKKRDTLKEYIKYKH